MRRGEGNRGLCLSGEPGSRLSFLRGGGSPHLLAAWEGSVGPRGHPPRCRATRAVCPGAAAAQDAAHTQAPPPCSPSSSAAGLCWHCPGLPHDSPRHSLTMHRLAQERRRQEAETQLKPNQKRGFNQLTRLRNAGGELIAGWSLSLGTQTSPSKLLSSLSISLLDGLSPRSQAILIYPKQTNYTYIYMCRPVGTHRRVPSPSYLIVYL